VPRPRPRSSAHEVGSGSSRRDAPGVRSGRRSTRRGRRSPATSRTTTTGPTRAPRHQSPHLKRVSSQDPWPARASASNCSKSAEKVHPTWRYRSIGPPLKHGRSSSAGVASQAARRGRRGRGPTAGAGASVRGGGAAARTGEAVSPPRLGVATTSPCSWRWRGARARPRRGPPDRASRRRSACRRPGARPGVAAPSLAATPSSPSRA